MIEEVKGDILKSDCVALVNSVNTGGVMASGLCLAFRRAYPAMFLEYIEACKKGQVRMGKILPWRNPQGGWILNFPTKFYWSSPSLNVWISQGLDDLHRVVRERAIPSVAIPALGCGRGRLPHFTIKESVEALDWNGVRVVLYAPRQKNRFSH